VGNTYAAKIARLPSKGKTFKQEVSLPLGSRLEKEAPLAVQVALFISELGDLYVL
jgi:hypothetical protein